MFGCRRLKRWPLGTPYTTVVAEIERLTRKPPLLKAKLVIDGTDVGRPVVDIFRKARLPLTIVPAMITEDRGSLGVAGLVSATAEGFLDCECGSASGQLNPARL
jgi:hypothetical protein